MLETLKRWIAGLSGKAVDLVVFDDVFPHPQSAFRLEEFDAYLTRFKTAVVYSTGVSFAFFNDKRTLPQVIADHDRNSPALAGRTRPFDPALKIKARLAYCDFINNAAGFLDVIEKNHLPFVFTLYPGGGFYLNDDECDAKMRRVFGSRFFRRVIVTQKITYDYLVEKRLCPADRIDFIYGVVTPDVNLTRALPSKIAFGKDKKTFDICFTAHKYTPDGRDKGYDIFLDVARRLAALHPEYRFHVVGNYDENDLPITGLEGRITFHGGHDPEWFGEFYRDKDMILLCNVPFVLREGAFDGFPTGCGSDAMLHRVAQLCTDPLGLNSKFADGKELVIVPHDPHTIVGKILYFRDYPEELRAIGEAGYRAALNVYGFDAQVKPRIKILEREIVQAG